LLALLGSARQQGRQHVAVTPERPTGASIPCWIRFRLTQPASTAALKDDAIDLMTGLPFRGAWRTGKG